MVFTGNHAIDRIPLTGWIQAHRAIHSIAFPRKHMPQKLDLWERVMRRDLLSLSRCYEITESDGSILHHFDEYGWIVREDGEYDENKFQDEFINYMVSAIGTMLSSKQNKIPRNSEFFMECGAQYILRNNISLENRMPKEMNIWGYYGGISIAIKVRCLHRQKFANT